MPSAKPNWTFSCIREGKIPATSSRAGLTPAPMLRFRDTTKLLVRLRRRHRQRGLLGGERHTGLLAVQPPYCARNFEHLPRRTRGVLHKGDLIGCKHKGFGFQDGFGKARQRNRG